MDRTRKWAGLLALAVLALGLRVGLTLALAQRSEGPRTFEHGEIADNLLAGRGFRVTFLGQEGPTSQQSPLYPALLAAAYRCFGSGTPQAILAVQLLQCAAGTALVLAVVGLAWSLVPERPGVGWVAGAGAAVYPTHVYMVTHLQVALWAALALTLWMATAVAPRLRGTLRGAILVGLLAGISLLLEPIFLVAVPIMAVVLWRGAGSRAAPSRWAAWQRPLAMCIACACVLTPWVGRNYRVHGEFVFVKSTFGYALWQGNNPQSWGTDKILKAAAETLRHQHDGSLAGIERALWDARHETLYIDDVLLKPTGYREFAGLSEPARSRLLGQRAWRFIRENPGRYARLCLRRLRYFLLFDETNPKAANAVYRAATVVWLVLAAAGTWISRRRWRSLWPTWAVFAAVMVFHALVIVSARFRIPVEPLSFVWAALAVMGLLGWLRRTPRRVAAPPPDRPLDVAERQPAPAAVGC